MWSGLSEKGAARIQLNNEEVLNVGGGLAADRSTYEIYDKNDVLMDSGK